MLRKYIFLSLAMSFCFTQGASKAQVAGTSWQQASQAVANNGGSLAAVGGPGNTSALTSTRALNPQLTPYILKQMNMTGVGLLAPQDPFMSNSFPSAQWKYGFTGAPSATNFATRHGFSLPGTSTSSVDLNTVDNSNIQTYGGNGNIDQEYGITPPVGAIGPNGQQLAPPTLPSIQQQNGTGGTAPPSTSNVGAGGVAPGDSMPSSASIGNSPTDVSNYVSGQ